MIVGCICEACVASSVSSAMSSASSNTILVVDVGYNNEFLYTSRRVWCQTRGLL